MSETLNPKQTLRFEYEEKRQQVADIEIMIADFKRMASDLEQQIKLEQQASGITDVTHFAYPTFARAAMARRDNLRSSVSDLERRLESAKRELAEAYEQLKLSEASGIGAERQIRSGIRRRSHRLFGSVIGNR